MLITPEQALNHLHANAEDAAMILLYTGAAEQSALDFINRQVYADTEALAAAVLAGTGGASPIVVNDAIRAAILLILGHLYANREDSVIGTIASDLPMGSRSLLAPHRTGLGV